MEKIDYIPGTSLKIIQDREKFSFGVDAILLSDFARIKKKDTVLEIGCGNGIVSLRCHALYRPEKIIAFEIQEDVAALARRSVELNGIETVEIVSGDVKEEKDRVAEGSVDVILTNPPYFKEHRALLNALDNKTLSRHEITLKLGDVFCIAGEKLKERGRLYMIHRPNRLVDVLRESRNFGLEPKRMRFVQSRGGEKPQLFLVEFVKGGGEDFRIEAPILIYEGDRYTKEVLTIYGMDEG